MSPTHIYKRNKNVGITAVAIVWGILIICLIIINILLKSIAELLNIGENNLRLVLNVSVILIFAAATAYSMYFWDKVSVQIAGNSLVLQKGWTKKMISFNNISSVTVTQTHLGKLYNYGTVEISFLMNEQPVSMSTIENPNQLSTEIKEQVAKTTQRLP